MVGIIIRKRKIKQNTGKMHEMLENASVQSSISFGVVSDMLRRWCESSGPITEWSEAISKRWGITFDTQLNLSLKVRWPCWVVALSSLPWLLVTMLGSCFEFSSLTFGLFVLPFCLQRVVRSNHPCDCTILARFLLLKPHLSLPLNCLSTFFFSWLSHKSPFFYVLSLWWTEWGVSLVSLILLVFFFFSFVRSVYPGSQGQFSELPGCGLLRLHSTYRHDLKIYASDEGRVQMTAAAFAKVTIQKLRSKSWLLCRECQESVLLSLRNTENLIRKFHYTTLSSLKLLIIPVPPFEWK